MATKPILSACKTTGFALQGAPDHRMKMLAAYTESGTIVLQVENKCIAPVDGISEALQCISPAQARAMARRLFALADEVERPRDPMEGPGKEPLTEAI